MNATWTNRTMILPAAGQDFAARDAARETMKASRFGQCRAVARQHLSALADEYQVFKTTSGWCVQFKSAR